MDTGTASAYVVAVKVACHFLHSNFARSKIMTYILLNTQQTNSYQAEWHACSHFLISGFHIANQQLSFVTCQLSG